MWFPMSALETVTIKKHSDSAEINCNGNSKQKRHLKSPIIVWCCCDGDCHFSGIIDIFRCGQTLSRHENCIDIVLGSRGVWFDSTHHILVEPCTKMTL